MKWVCIVSLLILSTYCNGQDSYKPLEYSVVLKADSLDKGQIFDKVLVWFSKAFNNSKLAIQVQDKNSGIIAGKASYQSKFKIPSKKIDSSEFPAPTLYYFDWLVEIREGKLKISGSNFIDVESPQEYIVTDSPNSPYEVWLQPKKKTDLYWQLSNKYLFYNLNKTFSDLANELNKKNKDW